MQQTKLAVYFPDQRLQFLSQEKQTLIPPSTQSDNVTVHRAAANDIDFRSRAARGSVCNGLL